MTSAIWGVEVDVNHAHHLNFEKRFQLIAERAHNLDLCNLLRSDTD